jgi:hypothetical protein
MAYRRPFNLHNVPTNMPKHEPTHDVTCTGCGTLFACARGHESELHERRAASGWKDLCPDCNRKDMASWSAHLRTLPETRLAGENENLTDSLHDGFNRFGR